MPRALLPLLLLLPPGPSLAQQGGGVVELSTSSFSRAAQMPFAWLLQLDSHHSPQAASASARLKPIVAQAARYYNELQPSKGIRVGRIDMHASPELARLFCDDRVCPPLVMYKRGSFKSYTGGATAEEIVTFARPFESGGAAPPASPRASEDAAYRARAAQAAQQVFVRSSVLSAPALHHAALAVCTPPLTIRPPDAWCNPCFPSLNPSTHRILTFPASPSSCLPPTP